MPGYLFLMLHLSCAMETITNGESQHHNQPITNGESQRHNQPITNGESQRHNQPITNGESQHHNQRRKSEKFGEERRSVAMSAFWKTKSVKAFLDTVLNELNTKSVNVSSCSHSHRRLQDDRRLSCLPWVACPAFYDVVVGDKMGSCHTIDSNGTNIIGIRCPEWQNYTTAAEGRVTSSCITKSTDSGDNIVMADVGRKVEESHGATGTTALLNAAKFGISKIEKRDSFEKRLREGGHTLTAPSRPDYGYLQFFQTSRKVLEIGRKALINLYIYKYLRERLEGEKTLSIMNKVVVSELVNNTCPTLPKCQRIDNLYRRLDGGCNNLMNPLWGRANTPFLRLLPPNYSDGIDDPKVAVNGSPLPSARLVSSSIAVDGESPSPNFTLSVMQWGQFIDHDLTFTPIFRFDNRSGVECCNEDGKPLPETLRHPDCFHISIPSDDPFYSKSGHSCMNFVRSLPAIRNLCTLGPREQMNQVTHFLDGSTVYGSSPEQNRKLRHSQDGFMKMQEDINILPIDPDAFDPNCARSRTGTNCLLAGDKRVNVQPDLALIHTLIVRQHNQIAKQLRWINQQWRNDRIFQETRRIIIGQIQHIVFNEWLPVVVGHESALKNHLIPLRKGFANAYNHSINPTVTNEFSTVAFRFGHTLIPGRLRLFDSNHRPTNRLLLRDHFESSDPLRKKTLIDSLVVGLTQQPSQNFDNLVTREVTTRLFKKKESIGGLDLIALNTQRARDHGIPSYNDLRERCRLKRAKSFNELRKDFRKNLISKFVLLYESVDDIDPFIGGISEVPLDGIVGPTFRCIIADQFKRLKFGDRFYYENEGSQGFTIAQLEEIRKTSWARVLCDTNKAIKYVQPLAMRLPGSLNQKVSCDNFAAIPKLDINKWRAVNAGI